jgi:hypothetical protein
VIGYASDSWLTVDPLDVLRSYTAGGVFAGGTVEEDQAAYGQLVEPAERGATRTPVTTVVALTTLLM